MSSPTYPAPTLKPNILKIKIYTKILKKPKYHKCRILLENIL
jgi:hypothetical protein